MDSHYHDQQQYGSRLCEIRLFGHVPMEVGDLRLSVDVLFLFAASESGCLYFSIFYKNHLDTHIRATHSSIAYSLFSTYSYIR